MRKSTICLSDPKQSVEILKCACEITSEYAMDKWFCTYGNDLLVINKNLILSILLNYDNIHINCIQMRAKILSILSHGCIDFGVVLIRHLVRTLKGQILKENMQSSERLIIASTLIAELCKFNVCPTIVLELLRSCVKTFVVQTLRFPVASLLRVVCIYVEVKLQRYQHKYFKYHEQITRSKST